jgi:DNA-binding transcriptional MerR regulator
MKIGDLSKATGVEVGTIRFYERAGLIDLPDRLPNGYRSYGPRHLESLAFVRHCRALDIPMADIRRLLDLATLPSGACINVDELVDQQIERVRTRITSLKALQKQLTVLRAKCSKNHPDDGCGILGELVSAAHGEACVCHS